LSETLWGELCYLKPWGLLNQYIPGCGFKTFYKRLAIAWRVHEILHVEENIRILEEFINVPDLVIRLLECLASLTEVEEERIRLEICDGLSTVLRVMHLYRNHAAMQTAVCRVLVTAARPIGGFEGATFRIGMETISNAGRIGSGGGITLILEAMKKYPYDASLQAMACWSLVNIALVPSLKQAIIAANGFEWVITTMRLHPENVEVQFRAIFALVNLVSPVNVLPTDAVKLLVQAMSKFPSNHALVNRACIVLQNLSFYDSNHEVMKAEKVDFHLAAVLRNYEYDLCLCGIATKTIERLGREAAPELPWA